jgi:predicted DNA-binding antitoxin AbrB/MazE fold protein
MTDRFTAIVDHGVLRPTTPIALEEGATVEVVIVSAAPNAPAMRPAEILREIASLPTLGGDPTTGRRHDDVLYGLETEE